MKKVIITNYIHGLVSFLDEQKIKWEHIDKDSIIIHYKTDEQLFKIGFWMILHINSGLTPNPLQ